MALSCNCQPSCLVTQEVSGHYGLTLHYGYDVIIFDLDLVLEQRRSHDLVHAEFGQFGAEFVRAVVSLVIIGTE